MNTPLEFILEAISKISNINRSESLIAGHELRIEGTRGNFFIKEKVELSIKRHPAKPETYAYISASINNKNQFIYIQIHNLYEIFKNNGMLDFKLQLKLDLLFGKSKLSSYSTDIKESTQQRPPASLVVFGYQNHLENSWPHLKESIKIKLIDSSKNTQIGFTQNLGWENKEWLSFLYNGILLEAALRNCDLCGVSKLVFFYNDEYADYTIDELRDYDK